MAHVLESGQTVAKRKVPHIYGKKQSSALKNEDAAQRKAALEAAIRKKIEAERKALQVVERLLEEDITEEFLVDCGKIITPPHYKDVVEERFIIKLCGYPICQKRLQNVPKQKYKISTKTNKVYDITERKCFCSNFCYRASKYFEAQISKSPVWLREEERPPEIELLKDGESGHSGKEVKLVNEAINTLDVENPLPAVTQGDSSIDSESSSEAEQEFVSSVLQEKSVHPLPRKGILKEKCMRRAQPKPTNADASIDDAAEQLSRCKLDTQGKEHVLDSSRIKGAPVSLSSPTPETVQLSEGFGDSSSGSQVVFLGVSPKGAELFKRLLAKSKQIAKPTSEDPANLLTAKYSLLEGLRQTFTEWKTEETAKLLQGSDAAATYAPQPSLAAGHEEEEELDEDDLESDNEPNKAASERGAQNPLSQPLPFKASSPAAKPIPSYEKLKEETSQLELKVQEFYRGNFALGEEDLATLSRGEQHHSNDNGDHQRSPALPLVDSKAQQQIRTRIVLEKLRKVLPAVLGPLRIPLGDVYSELKDLVKTFRLTNTNIIHKTPVWTLIAIVLLSVLSQNIPVFASSQHSQGYSQFLATLLEELHFKNEDFESLTRIFRSNSLPY
ncbi:putative RNA polymerase II subunit B1 CTD phosphatase RPAP2 isoform X2 [Podarcis raffonei]|uniref:putative RNA polymerase II subunit B1 CTD phosphatase RPAP2 isoform X1 n=1 Tax=Podarcis raffonei TaxID=65483 RepID=UPI0023295157|nr:putative RNA polymerase II subunit B1 CTD phosphatase RPAP2 isoform X1 [Podarcis raffonei]XP_053247742.1 putative RNA polymerase II subunit B1 CTD phosphatase RPAP2 isoform X2 [Podarcis raffonei]